MIGSYLFDICLKKYYASIYSDLDDAYMAYWYFVYKEAFPPQPEQQGKLDL